MRYPMPMNLRQMEVFRAVMREGSITAAAASLNVSQPSVSEIIKHAEVRCGLKLFEREKGRLRPTPHALRLRDEVETVFMQVQKVNRLIDELKSQRDLNLQLGCVYSLTLALVPKIISRLHMEQPNIFPRVIVERRDEVARKVSNGLLDAALTFLSDTYPGTDLITLKRAPLRFLCLRSHPLADRQSVTLAELAGETFIGYLPHLSVQRLLERSFAQQGHRFRPVFSVEQMVQAWVLVQDAQGVAIVDPFSQLETFFPSLASIEISDLPLLPLELVVKKDAKLSPALETLIALVTRQDEPGGGR